MSSFLVDSCLFGYIAHDEMVFIFLRYFNPSLFICMENAVAQNRVMLWSIAAVTEVEV